MRRPAARPERPDRRSAEPELSRVSPWKLGGLSVGELARRVYAEIWSDELTDRAAALSYYFVFALFPAALFVTTLVGLLPIGEVFERMLAYGETVLPPDAASMLLRTLREIQAGARGGLLSFGALGALWAASRGMQSIITALNVVYEVQRPRPWWKRQLVAVFLTVVVSVFALAAMAVLVFGGRIGEAVTAWVGLGGVFTAVWSWVQLPLGVLFIVLAIDLIYHFAPAVRQPWHSLTPGAALAVAAWVLTSLGLRAYVTHFANYNATYGSIGGVILLLLWLYLSGLALLVGGEINSVIAQAAAERGEPMTAPLEAGPDRRDVRAAV